MKLDPEETILLTQEDYDAIVKACANPPKLTPAMVEAVKRYRERFVDDENRN